MELMFITLIGVVIGLAARALVRAFSLIGYALLPAFGGASSAIVWVALTWLRFKWDQPFIWTITLVVAALTVTAVGIIATRARRREDVRLFDTVQAAPV